MIYFDQESAVATLEAAARSGMPDQGDPHSRIFSRSTLAEYSHKGRGYLLQSCGNLFRFVRFEEGRGNYYSKLYRFQIEALEAVLQDRMTVGWSVWGEVWTEDLILDIAALRPRTPDSAYGRATARFSRRLLSVYGDAELGYIFGRTLLGKYRFIRYNSVGHYVSKNFRTEREALEAVYEDCLRRGSRHWGMDWAQELFAEIEPQLDGTLEAGRVRQIR